MKKLTRSLTALVLVAIILCGVVPVASATGADALIDIAGWEEWNPILQSNGSIRFTAPKLSATDDEIYYYVGKLISENPFTPSRLRICFPQPTWQQSEGNAWFQANRVLLDKRWQYGDAYIQITSSFSDGAIWIGFIQTDSWRYGPNGERVTIGGPDMELVAKVREVGEAAKAASDTARGQVEYIAAYLGETVTYGEVGDYNSARGALLNGHAVCAGFTDAVSVLCDYLGIPSFVIDNVGVTKRDETHAWNGVYLDGGWRHLEATGSGTIYDELDGSNGIHVYDAELVAAKQAAVLAGWEGITAPFRSTEAVRSLTERGILRGDQSGNLNLNSGLTRAELATILTRLSGAEDRVMADKSGYTALCTFSDVPDWAKPYVGYCVEQGLVQGYSSTTYGASDPVTPAAACTVILRHMGYPETDWNYNSAIGKAASVGLISPYWPTGTVALRADMALLAYTAINK